MADHTHDPDLERIVARLADGEDLDWDELVRVSPELAPLLSRLADVAEISHRHLREIHTTYGSHSGPLGPLELLGPRGTPRPPYLLGPRGTSDPLTTPGTAAAPVPAPPGTGATRPPSSADVAVEPPPTHWGALEVRERIGQGSFGEVFRAYDPALQRDVALKLQRRPRRADGDADGDADGGADGGAQARMHLEEARRLARVRHPNVLAVHGVETHDGRVGLWTDLLRGATLAEVLQREEPMEEVRLVRIGVQLCSALTAIHDAGVLHGDVKPANVLLEENGQAVLMDFGAGRRLEPSASGAAAPVFGTPIMLAPELLEGGEPTEAGDLYSLGVLLYRVASGRYPVEAPSIWELLAAHERGERIPLHELRPDFSPRLTRAIDRAIAPDPGARFETAAQFESALGIEAFDDPSLFPSPLAETDEELPDGAPRDQGRFLGRERELRAVWELLEEHRCVTLIGTGGAGKTRLALEAVRRLRGRYPGGIRWVDLSVVVEPSELDAEIAEQLSIRPRGQESAREAVLRGLPSTSSLLVLDNAEHVRGGVREFATALLNACPRVDVLLTSREALRIEGESLLAVGPMGLPPLDDESGMREATPAPANPAVAESVRLFLDRANRANPSFRATPATLAAISRIVHHLDGLPLAIELAAARVVSMDVDELATRLTRTMTVLAQSDRARPRHQTMREALSWSWSLLSEAEQTLLRRLSVFRGGATLVAIEHVAADPNTSISAVTHEAQGVSAPASPHEARSTAGPASPHQSPGAPSDDLVPSPESLSPRDETPGVVLSPEFAAIGGEEVFLVLDGLVRKSLVRIERGRYRLYEVVSQFAREKSTEAGEWDAQEARFLRFFLRLAVEAERRLFGTGQDRWYGVFHEERVNFETALALLLRPTYPCEAGLRLVASLGRHWAHQGLLGLGVHHIERQLQRSDAAEPSAHLADALNWGGNLATSLADYPRAIRHHERGLAVQRARNFVSGVGTALGGLGDVLVRVGDFTRARECLEENVAIQREAGLSIQLSMALTKLAVLSEYEGKLESARSLHEEALELRRTAGDEAGAALSLSGIGRILLLMEQDDAALACLLEALAMRRKLNDRDRVSTTLNLLAEACLVRGRSREAIPYLRESLQIQLRARRPTGVFQCLFVLGTHAESTGRTEDCLTLLAAAYAVRESVGETLTESEAGQLRERKAALTAALTSKRAHEAWVAGTVMSLEDTLAHGVAYLDRVDAEG
ncbi:MAG: protein kinase [Candidatus Eisenbacteria bacterium]